jgi:preprotein translocase subunit SecE
MERFYMAEEVKTSKVAATSNKITKYFKDVTSELKKVVWPTRIQVIKNTITVLVACFLVGVIIWLADAGFAYLRKIVFKL